MTHGHAKTRGGKASPTYNTWVAMIQRCTNPKHRHFDRYGGRGVKVCGEWRSFETFLADMGVRPEGKTLDRFPDKDGDYSPGNCRWADSESQQSNRCNNALLTFNGVTRTKAQWERETGIGRGIVTMRIKRGWTVEQALTTPPDRRFTNPRQRTEERGLVASGAQES